MVLGSPVKTNKTQIDIVMYVHIYTYNVLIVTWANKCAAHSLYHCSIQSILSA